MNRTELILRTESVLLRRFDHPPDEAHADPERESSAQHSISFVEAGSFDVELEGTSRTFAPGSIFVTTGGMEFACGHDREVPTDRCLSVAFSEEAVDALLTAGLPPLRPPHAPVTNRQRYLRHRLISCGPGQGIRLELVAAALFQSLGGDDAAGRTAVTLDTTDAMRRIERATALIESDFARDLTLRELAAAANQSPFHFARTFRALTGMPPHRYLTAVRLRHAAQMLEQGASVTSSCYAVGFATLSHFVTSFRRRFGIVPSAARHGVGARQLRAALAEPVWGRKAGVRG